MRAAVRVRDSRTRPTGSMAKGTVEQVAVVKLDADSLTVGNYDAIGDPNVATGQAKFGSPPIWRDTFRPA